MSAILRIAVVCAALLLMGASESLAQDTANGESLYRQFCQACHGFTPMAGPDRAAGNPELIRNAIASKVPDMRVLSFLTPQNLADIAAWIATLSAPAAPPPAPDRDYTDLWWGGDSESGWGLNIIQHPSNVIFAVMYTYDAAGHPIWFVLPGGSWTSSNTFSGAWYRVTGKAYDRPFAPPDVRQVGIATITFTDASNGLLGFVVNGTVVNKSIQRQPF